MKKRLTQKQLSSLGGLGRAKKLSPARRREIAMLGVAARLKNLEKRKRETLTKTVIQRESV